MSMVGRFRLRLERDEAAFFVVLTAGSSLMCWMEVVHEYMFLEDVWLGGSLVDYLRGTLIVALGNW
jgi:hypothetical protein